MTYKHLNTGAIAELIEKKELTVKMKVVETGEIKEVGSATFKRWWKPVETEAKTETASTEPTEEQSAPEEPHDVPSELEAPKAEENTPEAKEVPADDRGEEEKPLALSEIVSKLESLFDLLNTLYFEHKLPRPIITVQSSPKFFGHCSTKKIWKAGSEGEGEGQYEINIGAEFLNRPSEYTAATMLHEMVHLYCRENDLEETCQNGRYHNKLFKQECEARGLTVEYDRTNGYSTTLPSESFVENLRTNGFALKVPFARHTLEKEKKKAEREKSHKYFCPTCGQEVRTTQELNLICGICEIPMERAD
jgi:hypothetical protein